MEKRKAYAYYEERSGRELQVEMGKRLNFPSHLHGELELFLVQSGCVCVGIDGEFRELKAGELAVVFPNTVHSYQCREADSRLRHVSDGRLFPQPDAVPPPPAVPVRESAGPGCAVRPAQPLPLPVYRGGQQHFPRAAPFDPGARSARTLTGAGAGAESHGSDEQRGALYHAELPSAALTGAHCKGAGRQQISPVARVLRAAAHQLPGM